MTAMDDRKQQITKASCRRVCGSLMFEGSSSIGLGRGGAGTDLKAVEIAFEVA